MIIDGHAHCCGDFYDAEKLISILDRNGVDKVVICPGQINDGKNHSVPALSSCFEKHDVMFGMNRIIRGLATLYKDSANLDNGNVYAHSICCKHPERVIQFYWTNPLKDDVMADLKEKYQLWGYKGIKMHQCFADFCFTSDTLGEIAEFARENNLPVFIHIYSKEAVRQFMTFIKGHPWTTFIVGHLIGMELFEASGKRYDNIFFDISPASLVSEYRLLKAVKVFGAERLIFGSDTPYGKDNQLNNMIHVKRLPIKEVEKEMILGMNIKNILSL